MKQYQVTSILLICVCAYQFYSMPYSFFAASTFVAMTMLWLWKLSGQRLVKTYTQIFYPSENTTKNLSIVYFLLAQLIDDQCVNHAAQEGFKKGFRWASPAGNVKSIFKINSLYTDWFKIRKVADVTIVIQGAEYGAGHKGESKKFKLPWLKFGVVVAVLSSFAALLNPNARAYLGISIPFVNESLGHYLWMAACSFVLLMYALGEIRDARAIRASSCVVTNFGDVMCSMPTNKFKNNIAQALYDRTINHGRRCKERGQYVGWIFNDQFFLNIIRTDYQEEFGIFSLVCHYHGLYMIRTIELAKGPAYDGGVPGFATPRTIEEALNMSLNDVNLIYAGKDSKFWSAFCEAIYYVRKAGMTSGMENIFEVLKKTAENDVPTKQPKHLAKILHDINNAVHLAPDRTTRFVLAKNFLLANRKK